MRLRDTFAIGLLVALFLLFYSLPSRAQAAELVTTHSLTVDGHPVTYIAVDTTNPRVELRPVLARGKAGAVADLAEMAGSVGAAAAVNGTFFNAYSDLTSWGTIVIDGDLQRAGNSGGAVGVTPDNRLKMARLRVQIKGSINGSEEWPNGWYAWDVNRNIDDPRAIVVFTPSFSQEMHAPVAATVTVRQGKVASVQSGPVPVPTDGFVIGFGSSALSFASKFRIGDEVNFRWEFSESGESLDWGDVRHVVQAGPVLVRNGEVALDIAADAMSEPKFYTKASWSFIGSKPDGTVLLGTVSGVTMSEMANVVHKLGLENAISLDGNASCGLWFRDRYLVRPGRKLSNCIAVVVNSDPRALVRLNGKLLPIPGYVKPPGRTMVPLRGIFEHLGARVLWYQETREATVELGNHRVTVRCRNKKAVVDGREVDSDVSAEIRCGRTYVPLRFVAEKLGADVSWDQQTRIVELKI